MNPTIFLVRHGETDLNDPKNEAIRGYSDIPLGINGVVGVKDTARFLADGDYPIQRVLSSPLQRAMMTAQMIADPFKAKVVPNHGLLPWNLGKLTGVAVKIAAAQMNYYQDYPDIKVTEGESYRDFYDRWTKALDDMLLYAETHLEEILVGVVHSRNLLALPSILGDRNIGDVPVKGGPDPESVTKIEKEDDTWTMKVIFEEKNNEMVY